MPDDNLHHHAWSLDEDGYHWLGTWSSYEYMDQFLDALELQGDMTIIDNVDPCNCSYGVGEGEPKDD